MMEPDPQPFDVLRPSGGCADLFPDGFTVYVLGRNRAGIWYLLDDHDVVYKVRPEHLLDWWEPDEEPG
jgi:hypothetical protein